MVSGNFCFTETSIKDLYLIDVKTYGDERGYFMETYKKSDFEAAGLFYDFVQDNQSCSHRGVLRGLEGALLSGENRRQMLIPRGFAHGFVVVSETAEFVYKCDAFYDPGDEGGILWNDPDLGIAWPEVGEIILSDKDRRNPGFSENPVAFF